MLRTLIAYPIIACALLLALAGGVPAATYCPAQPVPAETAGVSCAMPSALGTAGGLRLAEGPSRGCAENCVAQCRAAQASCGSGANCRAEFQICARRCVVSCGSR